MNETAALELRSEGLGPALCDFDIPYGFAQQHRVVALDASEGSPLVGYCENTPLQILHELRRVSGQRALFEKISEATFSDRVTQAYQRDTQSASEHLEHSVDLTELMQSVPVAEDLLAQEDDAPIIRLINAIFMEAIEHQASDIHLETFEDKVLVRFRIDGVLREMLRPQRALAQLLVSRIKIMAQLDIAEKRIPQDGRISVRLADREIDVRVSTMPTRHGERVVLRILDRSNGQLQLTRLGLSHTAESQFTDLLAVPHGIILVTGPTGSGKTTTLYAALSHLNDGLKNILTVEDPIEYDLAGIGQSQVNAKSDMTFARGLRAILRQDPDVVMIGEIRDKETADIAIQASLTGHLVLSTLHTNTAIGAIARLMDMGVESFLISSSVKAVVAQRLVRKLCDKCKAPTTLDPELAAELGASIDANTIIYGAVGCDACFNTGYQGRVGVYEVITVDGELSQLIHRQATETELTKAAHSRHTPLRDDGWRRVADGVTSVDEILRVTFLS